MKNKPTLAISPVVGKRQTWQNILARWVRKSVAAALIGTATFFTIDVYAADKIWDGPADGAWNYTDLNWSGSAFASGDVALFGGTGGSVVIDGAGVTVGNKSIR